MARGWESKSIESQQEDAARTSPTDGAQQQAAAPLSEQERRLRERRRMLELARARAVADLAAATAPAHRDMLHAAIAALDAQLQSLT